MNRTELESAIQNIDNASNYRCSFYFGEILIIAEIIVFNEFLKYKSYQESPWVQSCAEKIWSQLVSISFAVLYIYTTSNINWLYTEKHSLLI